MKHFITPIASLAIILIASTFIILSYNSNSAPQATSSYLPAKEKPTGPYQYKLPTIKPSESYTIILVGDSMTDYLGDNSDILRQYLAAYYPDKIFGIFNYGFGSTNILSLDDRLEHETTYDGDTFPPILGRVFDIIIIESFGHNPLSNLALDEGLKKQEEALDSAVNKITKAQPNAVIIFLATIAPSETEYAKGAAELTDEERSAWVSERKAYIENHIKYARTHNIPLINDYKKSFTTDGDVDLNLVNPDDHIHPSSTGVDLISKSIADYLFENNVLAN